MNEVCAICGKPAHYKCQHINDYKIKFYCENHKPELDEVCREIDRKSKP